MNVRERFNAVMAFEGRVRNLKTEHGYWVGVLRKWVDSRLPRKAEIPNNISDGD